MDNAARGVDGRAYPWGNTFDPARCNASGRSTTPVTRYETGKSPYGCYDMAGNVREWTSIVFRKYLYGDTSDLDSPERIGPRVCRGGSWGDYSISPSFLESAWRGSYGDPDGRWISVGFRCAKTL